MLPREHGAYFQMALPIVTSFAIAGVAMPAVWFAIAVIFAFLAHEPLLTVLGLRGLRAWHVGGRRAVAWLVVMTAVACFAGGLAIGTMMPTARWSVLLPLAATGTLALAVATRREKTIAGELAAAVAFASTAVPICLSAGAPLPHAVGAGAAFAGVFATSMLAVHVILGTVRGGGDPTAATRLRLASLVVTAAVATGLIVGPLIGILPWTTAVAAAPGLAVAAALMIFPPSTRHLRRVGWMLASASTTTALVLISFS
jgi:hypothetical protein